MNRRSFLQNILKTGVACAFLPGAMSQWKSLWVLSPLGPVNSKEFAQFLSDEINGTTHVLDRFRGIQSDMARFHPVKHKLLE